MTEATRGPDIVSLFEALEPIGPDEQLHASFRAAPIPASQARIGKDSAGRPAVLLETRQGERTRVPIDLENLSIQYNISCRVSDDRGQSKLQRLSIFRCKTSDRSLVEYFLRSCETLVRSLGLTPTAGDVDEAVRHLVELFRAAQNPGRRAAQGLWAELFVICSSRRPALVVAAWHEDPRDVHDFSLGTARVEVKSTRGIGRKHDFALEQLVLPQDARGLVASVCCRPSGGGVTVAELLDRIRTRLAAELESIMRVDRIVAETLGTGLASGLRERFDDREARASLQFYDIRSIPSVPLPVPPEVSNVRFVSDLSNVQAVEISDLALGDGLFASISPASQSSAHIRGA